MKLTTYRHAIPAGQSVSISARGRFIRGMASDSDYQVRIDDAAPTKFQTGVAFAAPDWFNRLEIINTAAVAQTIEIIIADGPVSDNRLVGQVDISGGIRLAGNRSADYGAKTVSTSALLIDEENVGRGTLLLQNLGGGSVFVGPDASVTAATGIEVAPGGSLSLTLQTDVYAIAASGTQDVRYIAESL